MSNNKWDSYSDSKILMMRVLTEDTFDVVKVTPLPDNRARFLHTVVFCRDYLDTQSAREYLDSVLHGFDQEYIEGFGANELAKSTAANECFDYPLLVSLITEALEDGVVMSPEDTLESVYQVTGCRYSMI